MSFICDNCLNVEFCKHHNTVVAFENSFLIDKEQKIPECLKVKFVCQYQRKQSQVLQRAVTNEGVKAQQNEQ
jgi:hypothetical protein